MSNINFKLSENLRREISLIIRKLKKNCIESENLTVNRVVIKEKSQLAKVFISSIKGHFAAKKAIKPLNQVKSFIKRELSNELRLKKCPEIEFIVDDFLLEEEKIEKILSKIQN